METKLAMKERHRIERLNAKSPPIGIFLSILIPLIAGTFLTFLISFFWGFFYWICGGMIFSFNSFVIHKRLEKIAERQKKERDAFENPIQITEVLD